MPEIVFITSFPPRECGIATYSQDLINALEIQFEASFEISICALESESEQHIYIQKPKYILNTEHPNSYTNLAIAINRNKNIQAVVLQHEFGFFSKMEFHFLEFLESISKPIVFVLHTVLPNPNESLKQIMDAMTSIASSIIVMTKDASKILINNYNVRSSKITIIQHGTHLVSPADKEVLKTKYLLSNREILTTFGLLGSSKGIEVTLEALPNIIKTHPQVLFLILGKTHPTILKNDGELYREMLKDKIKELKIEKHVSFVNEYLPLSTLLEYLQLTDIYLFTSKDPNQAVSGTFSYAVSCGCPIISTPIPHACEVLDNGAGIIVDFQNPQQLSDAVILLLDNEKLRYQKSLNGLHKMAPTAWQNSAIAHAQLFERLIPKSIKLKYRMPVIKLDHIHRMTTEFGIHQFSKIAQPDKDSGYTLDDNARALIAICQQYDSDRDEKHLILIETYFQFIKFCLRGNGTFLNYVNEQKEFTTQNENENLEDSNGRAVWALGYLISLKEILPSYFSEQAEYILQKILPQLDKSYSSRAMAFIIKGLYYQNDSKNFHLIKTLANRLVQMYRHERKNDWFWFETYLTYGNSILPEALLCAYLSTHEIVYKNIAKESFDFLLSKIFIDEKIKVISNKGWYKKDSISETQIGGEQPIDVAYTIMALEKFYRQFNEIGYKQKAVFAFNWFLGKNHLNQIIYNPCTGGCYDGLEEYNANLNQGAESTISYLLARQTMHQLISNKENLVYPDLDAQLAPIKHY
ncbi:MAG: glycosyltransferase [Saprospiraceae bacterium]|nr:glycosyltransferase [Saprospiraceae bacterium]